MSRPLRIELSGGVYHVTSRGDGREDIYFSDQDREVWLGVLGEVCRRFNWLCHAYCLMTNHYHLVVETPEGNLSQGMRQLNGVYTQYVNRTHQRVGHVFQGRYKAILVEKDSYLLELARYVVLNPVRAGIVQTAADWPWSSDGAMIGEAIPQPWLQTDWLLRQFGRAKGPARAGYADFVRAGSGLAEHLAGVTRADFSGQRDLYRQAESQVCRRRTPRRSAARPAATAVQAVGGVRVGPRG